eukprot:gene9366-biopygen8259
MANPPLAKRLVGAERQPAADDFTRYGRRRDGAAVALVYVCNVCGLIGGYVPSYSVYPIATPRGGQQGGSGGSVLRPCGQRTDIAIIWNAEILRPPGRRAEIESSVLKPR